MKKVILVLFVVCITSWVLALDFTPYGSARLGYWYEAQGEDYNGNPASRFLLNYQFQTNSRFGVDIKKDVLGGKVEFGAYDPVNLRLLYATYNFGSKVLLIGKDYTGFNEYASQVYGSDLNLIGYGALDESRRGQIKLTFDEGYYFALIQPNLATDPKGAGSSAIDVILPKVNVGYKMNMGKLYLHPTMGFQTYSYNKDITGVDDGVTSFVLACNAAYDMKPLVVKGQLSFGINEGNYGISGPSTGAHWDTVKNELNSASTIAFFGEADYKYTEKVSFAGGLGLASTSRDDLKEQNDSQMGLFVNAKVLIQKLQLIPEIGMINNMKDGNDGEQGSEFYFGTQLRMDF